MDYVFEKAKFIEARVFDECIIERKIDESFIERSIIKWANQLYLGVFNTRVLLPQMLNNTKERIRKELSTMERYKIIYLAPSIEAGDVVTDDLIQKEEIVLGEEALHKRLQELVDLGCLPIHRKVDDDGNIIAS